MTPLLFLWCSCLASLAAAKTKPMTYLTEHAEFHFENFIQKFKKQYTNEQEKQEKFEVFKKNLERINILNERSEHATFGITQFSDLTPDEFVAQFTGLLAPTNVTAYGCRDVFDNDVPSKGAPESYDWREQGVVTPVKNQRSCGGCYAFSASGNIESHYAIKHGQLLELSEQQIVDCDRGSHGCHGGSMASAFRTIIQQGGIESEADYPYVGADQYCRFIPGKAAVRVTDCMSINLRSQEKLKQLLSMNGPISIGVQATNFHLYHGGIMSDSLCNSGRVNHAVLLVGYGAENGVPYWIVKNSWGEVFGEQGYIRIHRGESALSCENNIPYSIVKNCWSEKFGEKGYFRIHRGEGFHLCGMLNDLMASSIVA